MPSAILFLWGETLPRIIGDARRSLIQSPAEFHRPGDPRLRRSKPVRDIAEFFCVYAEAGNIFEMQRGRLEDQITFRESLRADVHIFRKRLAPLWGKTLPQMIGGAPRKKIQPTGKFCAPAQKGGYSPHSQMKEKVGHSLGVGN